VRALNRILRSRRLNHYNESFFNWLTLAIYHICHWTQLERLLLLFVKEGVRSYIIMTKPLTRMNSNQTSSTLKVPDIS